jgi:tetratricopeptide (TPR) repeat protein
MAGCQPDPEDSQADSNANQAAAKAKTPAFVGSKSCRDCHADFYRRWSVSHHGLAMQPYTSGFAEKSRTVEPRQVVKIGQRAYHVELEKTAGWMIESGPGGERKYRLAHVMGGKNVYYFLAPLERGRLQVLPLAYDLRKKAWYDVAGSGVRHFPDRRDEALDWTDRMFTFNTTCFNCHVSQLATNYSLTTDTYQTTWAEPGISCESCHGPGADHVRAMEQAPAGSKIGDAKIIRVKDFTADQMNDLCATCHAKMAPISISFRPGDKFFDHFDLVTLENPDYYADGRDLGENYTQTSWLMSPCARSGKLACNHCHTSSGRLRYEGEETNKSCLPCHAKEVNSPAEHGHHPAGSVGNQCVACHMPMTQFAAMGRSDHSMRPPTLATTIRFQSPNACNLCHADRDAAWADTWVRKWYPRDYRAAVVRKAELIDAARKGQWKRVPEMLEELSNKDNDAVYKTSLVRLLQSCPDARKWPALVESLSDPSALVRSSSVTSLAGHGTQETVAGLLRGTKDESRLVRIRSAAALAAVRPDVFPPADRAPLERAVEEFRTAMRARPDDWSSHANLGDFFAAGQDFTEAVKCFETAHRLEPRAVGPMVNAAIAHSNLSQADLAERSLRRALKAEPANAAANFNLGLLLGEAGRLDEAEQALRAALKADPQMAAAAYNLGVLLATKNLDETLRWCREAHDLRPADAKYACTLAFYLRQKGDPKAAIEVLRGVLQRQPAAFDVSLLLADLYTSAGDRQAAERVYREASAQDGLSATQRAVLKAKLEILATKP